MDSHSAAPSTSPQQQDHHCRNWAELPQDVAVSIFLRLGAIEILTSLPFVCSAWRRICKDPSMWSKIDMRNLCDPDIEYDLVKMCKHAVDMSCGGLIDINIEYFGDDALLDYIANRSSHLKRLRLVCCHDISDAGLRQAAEKLLLLEELEISYCLSLSNSFLRDVGNFCPLLKAFRLNAQGFKRPHIECNEEALAIAENMPSLCQLQIFGNRLTNDGLLAILDGCPHLESLDLRQCFNVNLEGDLKRICSERIKELRCPYDFTDDYPFDAEIVDVGSSEEDYPYGFSDIDFMSDDDDNYYEFSGGSNISELEDFYFD